MKFIVEEKEWSEYVSELEKLIAKYEAINIESMGFPSDWKDIMKKS